jgi:hypothetical protein
MTRKARVLKHEIFVGASRTRLMLNSGKLAAHEKLTSCPLPGNGQTRSSEIASKESS